MSVLRRFAVLLTVAVAAAATVAGPAQAAPYGEIAHFGQAGTALGQFKPEEDADGFGVDPENNDVYVVDHPSENDEFRIQMFEPNAKNEYKAVASLQFKPKHAPHEEEFDLIEGVAIDPKLGRVYVLASEVRPEEKIDPNEYAAETLYAFATKPVGSALVSAEGVAEGVLVPGSVFSPTSNKPGVSLLEPTGIAVDPLTDEIIVAGSEEAEEQGGVPAEPQSIVERFSDTGAFGGRYVDGTGVLEDSGANPLVSASGEIYLQNDHGGELFKVPASFNDNEAPEPFILPANAQQGLWDVPGVDGSEDGDGAAIGAEGTIYVHAGIREQIGLGKFGFNYPGVVSYAASGAEEGWTGGVERVEKQETPCAISLTSRPAALIAAGTEHKLFVYDDSPREPRIVEFGPGGTGCPTASATAPSVSYRGNVVTGQQVRVGDELTFSSDLTQANALNVRWVFGDGHETKSSEPEFEKTSVLHSFTKSGNYTVKEIIQSDNLANPVIEQEVAVDVLAEKPKVSVGEVNPIGTTTATIKATVNPEGGEITNCEVEYGPTEHYGSKVACNPKSGFIEPNTVVTGPLTGLSEHTSYDFKVLATNSAGTGESVVGKFATDPKVPTVATQAATNVTSSSASLNGTVNPNEEAVEKCYFQYGPTTSYGSETPCATTPGKGSSAVAVAASLSGLSPSSTYHFRVVSYDTGGAVGAVAYGSDQSFTTAAIIIEPPVNTQTNTTPQTPPGTQMSTTPVTPPPPVVTPLATLASTSTSVSAVGAFVLKVSCPANAGSCSGSVTVKTIKAVVAKVGHSAKTKAAILTLASASYTVAGGQTKTLTLHLSSQGRSLLAHAHAISARVTITASDPSGGTHTTLATATLRPAAKGKHHG